MQGWIKIHRKIGDNQIFKDPFFLKLWMMCLLKAAHKPYRQLVGRKMVPVGIGQFITGVGSITDEFNDGIVEKKHKKSSSTVWRMLHVLEQEQMIQITSYTRFSIVTVVNWSEYQTEEAESKPQQQAPPPPPTEPPKKKPKKFAEDSTYYKMAVYFRGKVDAMAADHGLHNVTKRANMQSWAKDFQLLVERDGQKDKHLILAVMEWVVQDDFWMDKVLSAKKFREQFPKLVLAMRKQKKKPNMPTTEERQKKQDFDDKLREWVMEGGNPDDFRYDDSS
ncbi:hypothetical protein M5X00_16630 [Paenibacillus alvei]|uniref:hypothetical protein n=1 Tax=Paenibacillus alvei TaxID=44250 RepID=UPI000288E5A0|nr:hypothetical protein [Paenibacillus alvei]EJW17585.1 hypothetical protein PAV_3c00300 [Paenibacillus alvei DSM 29]MCY9544520.1 hypothetical protein [Paenibacillus alvei]MCY9706961.1 hypothetical protein [Paenibacillus alvei]MCY9736069.1 hypothetical protein [Paenibacillus alvei]MCY9755867.1 hypothetical protein [Paenibacillus alvei]